MKAYCLAPQVPEELEPLLDVAYNFWWTTDPQAQWLFRRMSPGLWRVVNHNPVMLLRMMTREELSYRAKNAEIVRAALEVRDRMYADLQSAGRYRVHPTRHGENDVHIERNPLAAYFSAEFGLHESLPIYSGGLGILAGDHIRSSSDLGIPFVGVGLLYRNGYFHQRSSLDDWQVEEFKSNGFHNLPLKLMVKDDGTPLTILLFLPGRDVKAQVWLAQVGRTSLFLLDTYLKENWVEDREITSRLYDAGREVRLKQEILLGVGGTRVLEALHITPRRFHMNEGHSAFLVLERAAQMIRVKNVDFEEAREVTRASNVFTTHTPVPAGHEVFKRSLMEPYFESQISKLRISTEQFFALGRRPDSVEGSDEFEMTSLALRFSERTNGVSKKHGEVSRKMWQCMWPNQPEAAVPIDSITNGIHLPSWLGPEMRELVDRHLGENWIRRSHEPALWNVVDVVPDHEIWGAHVRQKKRLIEFVQQRVQRQLISQNLPPKTLQSRISAINVDILTIGFARRFATYKRADLIFSNPERLAAILCNPERPVQIVFSGKAHPADDGGKRIMQMVMRATADPRYANRVTFVEDYDIDVARDLVQGVDIWLNTPRPPQEASGTSGMKACPNGALTLSTYDGWWIEAQNGINGWTIGDDTPMSDEDRSARDAEILYRLLEEEIIPLYYERDSSTSLPTRWIGRMRNSMKTVAPIFNTARMVKEYTDRYYLT